MRARPPRWHQCVEETDPSWHVCSAGRHSKARPEPVLCLWTSSPRPGVEQSPSSSHLASGVQLQQQLTGSGSHATGTHQGRECSTSGVPTFLGKGPELHQTTRDIQEQQVPTAPHAIPDTQCQGTYPALHTPRATGGNMASGPHLQHAARAGGSQTKPSPRAR